MATRVNKQFIAIILLVVLAGGGVIGALYILNVRKDATRNVLRGDQFFAAGEFDDARLQYGRAVDKQPGNRAYLDKYEQATTSIVPENADQARELYVTYVGILAHRAQHFPQDADEHLRLLEELYEAAMRGVVRWEQLHKDARSMSQRLSPGDPKRTWASLYEAIACRHSLSSFEADELDEAHQGLRSFLEANPDHDLGWGTLIGLLVQRGEYYADNDQLRRASEQFDFADSAVAQSRNQTTIGPYTARAYLIHLTASVDQNRVQFSSDAFLAALDELMDALETNPKVHVLEYTARVAPELGGSAYRDRVIDILDKFGREHTDAYGVRLVHARLLGRTRDNREDATDLVRAVLDELTDDQNRPGVGILSRLQYGLRADAASALFDFAYLDWEGADQADRPAHLDRLSALRDEMEMHAQGADARRLLLPADGKLAFAREDWNNAVRHFEDALDAGLTTAEVYRFVAASHEKIGNVGMAQKRAAEGLQVARNDPQLLYAHTRYAIAIKQPQLAESTLVALEQILPDDDRVRSLRTQFNQRSGVSTSSGDDVVVAALRSAQEAAAKSEWDEARATLAPLIEAEDERFRVAALELMVRIESAAGEKPAAQQYLDQALELVPRESAVRTRLQQLAALLDNNDPIDALEQFTRTINDDAGRAALAFATGLRTMQIQRERDLKAAEQRRDSEAITQANAMLARIETKKASATLEAERLLPADDPDLFEFLFVEHLRAEAWQQAEAMIQKHNQAQNRWNFDGVDGDLFRARLELARRQYDEAVLTLLDVTRRINYSTVAWRSLGFAYEQTGNRAEALRAYEEAYDRNPNDFLNAQALANALTASGEQIRALQVLEHLRSIAPSNTQVREQWLSTMAQVGDRVEALRNRLVIYDRSPQDQTNTLRLALMLTDFEPTRESMFDASGEPRYSARQWNRMSADQRSEIVGQYRERWLAMAESMADELADLWGRDIRVSALNARLSRRQGEPEAGERLLRDFIEATPPAEREPRMYLALYEYLNDSRKLEEALAALEAGRAFEPEGQATLALTIGNRMLELSRVEEALVAFEDAWSRNPDRQTGLRVIDCLVRLNRVDEAETRLTQLIDDQGADASTWLLSGAIARQRGDRALDRGDTRTANFEHGRFLGALNEAQKLDPKSPTPELQRAGFLYSQFQRSKDRAKLNDALVALDGVDAIRPDYPPAILLRVDVYRALGDETSAVGALRNLLDVQPGFDRARSTLIVLLLQRGVRGEAIAVAESGVEHGGDPAAWQESVGDLHKDGGDAQAAVAAYGLAMDRQPTAGRLAKLVELDLAPQVDDPIAAANHLRDHQELVDEEPSLIVLLARTHKARNRQTDARRELERALKRMTDATSPDAATRARTNVWMRNAWLVLDNDLGELESMLASVVGENLNCEMLRWLGRYTVQQDNDVSRAVALYRRAIDLAPGDDAAYAAQLQYEFGSVLTQNRLYDDAAQAFSKVLEYDQNNILAMNNFAYIAAEHLDDPHRALPFAEKAARLAADNAAVRDTFGRTLFLVDRYDDARREFDASLAIARTPSTLTHLAEVDIAQSRYADARRRLDEAGQLNPDSDTQTQIKALRDDIRTKIAQQGDDR